MPGLYHKVGERKGIRKMAESLNASQIIIPDEGKDLQREIDHLVDALKENGGFGSIVISFKYGEVSEIGLNLTVKPKKNI